MKTISITNNNRPVKSHSARSFLKSATKRQPLNYQTKTNQKLYTEPNQTIDTPKAAKINDVKSNRLLTYNLRKEGLVCKSPEEIQQENKNLKVQINHLNDVLYQQKSKFNQTARNYAKINKKMQIQYQDQKYYPHETKTHNLVEGVKYQYNKIKLKYERKCEEYNQLLKKTQVSFGEEYRIYAESLEAENKQLKDRFEGLLAKQKHYYFESKKLQQEAAYENGKLGKISQEEKDKQEKRMIEALEMMVKMSTLQKNDEINKQNIGKLREKIERLRQNIENRNIKMKYLDGLILGKANKMHDLVVRERKKTEQCKAMAITIQTLNKKLEEEKQYHKKSIEKMLQREMVKFVTEKNIFTKCLAESEDKVQKLTRQVQYLSTIISYIKSGDDPLQKMHINMSKESSNRSATQELLVHLEKSLNSIDLGDNLNVTNRKRVKTLIESGLKDLTHSRNYGKTELLQQIVISSENEMVSSLKGEQIIQPFQQLRQTVEAGSIKRSYLRHSEASSKVRPVKPSQVEPSKKEITLRLMHHRVQFEGIKQFFNFKGEQGQRMSKEKRRRMQYISMGQIKNTLMGYPFQLKEQEAFLLARYIVQDNTNEDIYCSLANEIERNIAKSIMRAFVAQYHLPNQAQAKVELNYYLGKIGKNMKSALSSLAPSGLISDVKFCQICQSIQVFFSQNTINYILSDLLFRSPKGLQHLEYNLIFSQRDDQPIAK